jgi:hypothetical protein
LYGPLVIACHLHHFDDVREIQKTINDIKVTKVDAKIGDIIATNEMHAIVNRCGDGDGGASESMCLAKYWARKTYVQSDPETLPVVRIFLQNGLCISGDLWVWSINSGYDDNTYNTIPRVRPGSRMAQTSTISAHAMKRKSVRLAKVSKMA